MNSILLFYTGLFHTPPQYERLQRATAEVRQAVFSGSAAQEGHVVPLHRPPEARTPPQEGGGLRLHRIHQDCQPEKEANELELLPEVA